jgi:anti-sigma factor RsiW
MRTHRHEPHTLAGAYALDALTRADRARFERHLARCQQCAAEISGLRETTARLAVAASAEPPAGLTQRAVAAAARTRQLPPLTRGTPLLWPPRRRAAAAFAGPAVGTPGGPFRRIWLPKAALAIAGAMVILAASLGLANWSAQHQLQQRQLHNHAIAAVLTARDAHMISAQVSTGGAATIVMSGREHALVFAAAGLAALPSTSCYELWLMGSGGDQPAAMLPPPQHGITGPVLAFGLKPGERLGLTIEPTGGSPHPTTPAILQIAL